MKIHVFIPPGTTGHLGCDGGDVFFNGSLIPREETVAEGAGPVLAVRIHNVLGGLQELVDQGVGQWRQHLMTVRTCVEGEWETYSVPFYPYASEPFTGRTYTSK